MGRNITLKLDDDLLKKAKLLAAERDSSVSQMLSEYLGEIIAKTTKYSDAKQNALKMMDKGFNLGFSRRKGSRDELH